MSKNVLIRFYLATLLAVCGCGGTEFGGAFRSDPSAVPEGGAGDASDAPSSSTGGDAGDAPDAPSSSAGGAPLSLIHI